MLTELEPDQKVTGAKQVMRALRNGQARLVYLADDADSHVTAPIASVCQDLHVPVQHVSSMLELGIRCGIQVGAAAAAVLRDSPAYQQQPNEFFRFS